LPAAAAAAVAVTLAAVPIAQIYSPMMKDGVLLLKGMHGSTAQSTASVSSQTRFVAALVMEEQRVTFATASAPTSWCLMYVAAATALVMRMANVRASAYHLRLPG